MRTRFAAIPQGDVLQMFEWVAEAPKRARIISIRGVRQRAGGVALLQASTCAARLWAQPLE